MKQTYTTPKTEVFNIKTAGYMCDTVLLGGSKPTNVGFGNNNNEDEAKEWNAFGPEEWPTYTAWED